MKHSVILITLIAMAGFSACKKTGPYLKGSGNAAIENRTENTTSKFVNDIEADVYITQDTSVSETQIEITADDNLLEHIYTRAEGNTLRIYTKNRIVKYKTKVVVYITTADVTKFKINGSGNMEALTPIHTNSMEVAISGSGNIAAAITTKSMKGTIDGSGNLDLNVNCDDSKFNISGSGDIGISGSAGENSIAIEGSGDFNGFNYETEETGVAISGSGNAHVNVSSNMNVKIEGSGDVVYIGSPSVEVSITGSGKVKRK